MKKKRFNLTILLLCLSLLFAGCRLAKEEAGPEAVGKDLFLGYYITRSPLEWDTPGAEEKEGRFYAVQEGDRYVFEGIDGISFFYADIRTEENEEGCISFQGGEIQAHMSLSVNDTDGVTSQEVSLEGTLTVSLDRAAGTFYPNPVYQCPDGRVYLVPGNGMSAGTVWEGSLWTVSAEETVTASDGSTRSTSAVLAIEAICRPETIVLLEMSADHRILSQTEYVPGQLPETLTPLADTSYLIVEIHRTSQEGEPSVIRTLVDSDAESFDTFYAGEDGICPTQTTALQWE